MKGAKRRETPDNLESRCPSRGWRIARDPKYNASSNKNDK